MHFIDLQAQYAHLKSRIDGRIQKVLDHGKYIMGPEVTELEENLSAYVGVKHTVGVANGTDALQLALMALGAGDGDAVFVPTFTFFASAEVIPLVGSTPVFVDIDPETFNICADHLTVQIEKTIKEGHLKPFAIMSVDLFGLPANYEAITRIAKKYGLKVIEDAAQGFGGAIDEKRACSFGDIATTSFFPAKPLGCYGDGGAIFTNDDDLAAKIRSLHVHGKGTDKYDNVRIGMNSRLDTIQAAILLEKLEVFPMELLSRNELAAKYTDVLQGNNEIDLPYTPKGYSSSWAQYTVKSKNRGQIMAKLQEAGIPTMIYYGTNMHEQTALRPYVRSDEAFPVAEKQAKEVFSLPMHPYMDEDELNIILNALMN